VVPCRPCRPPEFCEKRFRCWRYASFRGNVVSQSLSG
jgi:hypothetical protein